MMLVLLATAADGLHQEWNEDQNEQENDDEVDAIALQEALHTSTERLPGFAPVTCWSVTIEQWCTLSSVVACHIVSSGKVFGRNKGALELRDSIRHEVGEAGSARA